MSKLWIILKILCVLLMFFERQPSFAGEPGVSYKEILIGTTIPLTGPAAGIGTLLSKIEAETYFRHINETGGINGRKIEYIIKDDTFNYMKAVENTKFLIKEDEVFCLFASFGTVANIAIAPLLIEYKIPLFSPISWSRKLTHPINPFIFSLYPDFYNQAHKIVAYSKSINKIKIAILYLDNDYGNEGLEGTKEAIKMRGLELVDKINILSNVLDFKAEIARLKYKKPQTVILFTSDIQAAEIIKEAQQQSFNPQFIGASPIATQTFLDKSGETSEGTVIFDFIPDPQTSIKPGVKEYRSLLKKYFPDKKPNAASLIGYTSAKVLVEALKRTGRDLTRDKFIKTLENMTNYETGIIYPITFTSINHLGTKCPHFYRAKEGKFFYFKAGCTGDGIY